MEPDLAALRAAYARFLAAPGPTGAPRILLTGHSHQAWPDVAFEGQQRAFLDAAELVDDKWPRAFAVADEVRAGWARLLDDAPERVALGHSTHELVVRQALLQFLERIVHQVFAAFGACQHQPVPREHHRHIGQLEQPNLAAVPDRQAPERRQLTLDLGSLEGGAQLHPLVGGGRLAAR